MKCCVELMHTSEKIRDKKDVFFFFFEKMNFLLQKKYLYERRRGKMWEIGGGEKREEL